MADKDLNFLPQRRQKPYMLSCIVLLVLVGASALYFYYFHSTATSLTRQKMELEEKLRHYSDQQAHVNEIPPNFQYRDFVAALDEIFNAADFEHNSFHLESIKSTDSGFILDGYYDAKQPSELYLNEIGFISKLKSSGVFNEVFVSDIESDDDTISRFKIALN